jgi:hypothetical protein
MIKQSTDGLTLVQVWKADAWCSLATPLASTSTDRVTPSLVARNTAVSRSRTTSSSRSSLVVHRCPD